LTALVYGVLWLVQEERREKGGEARQWREGHDSLLVDLLGIVGQ